MLRGSRTNEDEGRTLRHEGVLLVVEDDACLRALISAALTAAGHRVEVAADAEAALALARELRPDAVVLDVVLPGMSGYEIAYQLRRELGYAFAIVFVSGTRVEELDERVGAMLGGDAYLIKPFDPMRLVGVVTNLLARRDPSPATAVLSERELEVLGLIAQGQTRRRIGERLGISPKTVGSHLERAMAKLGTSTQAQTVATALSLGLLNGVVN